MPGNTSLPYCNYKPGGLPLRNAPNGAADHTSTHNATTHIK